MPEEKNFFAGLVDFAFQFSIARRLVKVLYVIAILAGGITVVTCVVLAMQQSPSQGIVTLVAGIAAFIVGVFLVRLLLELALHIMRISEGIDRATHSGS